VNYFVCDVAFGDLTLEEALQTVELLGNEVLPAFAEPAPLRSGSGAPLG